MESNNKVSAIMQFVKGGQPQQTIHYIRMVEYKPDGSKEIMEETPCPCVDMDLEIVYIGNGGVGLAHSEEEVRQREGLL